TLLVDSMRSRGIARSQSMTVRGRAHGGRWPPALPPRIRRERGRRRAQVNDSGPHLYWRKSCTVCGNMRAMRVCVGAAVASLSLFACVGPGEEPTVAESEIPIRYGRVTSNPLIALIRSSVTGGSRNCTGAVIGRDTDKNRTWVITAAHCVLWPDAKGVLQK